MGNCLQSTRNSIKTDLLEDDNRNRRLSQNSDGIINIESKNSFNKSPSHTNKIETTTTVKIRSSSIRKPSDIWARLQSSPQIGEWLKNVPIFCRVPERKRNKVGGVMKEIITLSNECVFKQGEDGDRFYIIKQGIASVTVNDGSGEKEVAQLKQGDYFGETALLSTSKRNATVRAICGDLITLSLDSSTFKTLFQGLNVKLAKRKGITETLKSENPPDMMIDDHDTSKSEQEILQILDVLNACVLFQRFDMDQKKQFADLMWCKPFGPNEDICKKGEIFDNLYIVKRGIAVKFTEKYLKSSNEKIYETTDLTAGSLIGELGLMYNSPTQYSVKTNCDEAGTEFWLLNRKKFRKIVKDSSKKKFSEFENFIKTIPILESLLDFERKTVAETLEEIHFDDEHVIVKQGDIGDTFYIIRKGTAVVHKNGAQVCQLGTGDFFGERALIKNDVRAATVTVTSSDGMECLMLDREGFTLLLGPLGDIMNRKIAIEYDTPSNEKNKARDSLDRCCDDDYTSMEDMISADGQMSDGSKYSIGCGLDDLSIVGTLGKGSFGHVELVKYDNDYYALKSVSKAHVVELEQEEHIINEKRVLLSLRECPFIIKLYATFKDTECVYFLLEPVLGGELFALLRDRNAFDERMCAFYAACIVEAFGYMHSKHIIYRDLKPENLLLANNGYLKITDFGFAKFVTDRTWTLCGTPDYLAPEVVSGIGHNQAVDWWTLGILIYEMISSYPPFYDDDPMQTYTKIMHGNIHYPRHFSRNVIDLIKRLLRSKPTKRLGVIKGGTDNIKKHPWFLQTTDFDWIAFQNFQMEAPYKPSITGPSDISNFQEYSEDTLEKKIYVDNGSGWDKEF